MWCRSPAARRSALPPPTRHWGSTALRRGAVTEASGEVAVIIPARALNELSRGLEGETDRSVQVRLDKNQVHFRTERVAVVSRLIEGQFPKYERVVPDGHTRKLTIP